MKPGNQKEKKCKRQRIESIDQIQKKVQRTWTFSSFTY